MEELECGTRLVRRALLDDCLGEGLVAVDEDLRSTVLTALSSLQIVHKTTYGFTFAKGDTDDISVLLSPLGDLLNVAIFQLGPTISSKSHSVPDTWTHLKETPDERKSRRRGCLGTRQCAEEICVQIGTRS